MYFWNDRAKRYQWINGRSRFVARSEILEIVESMLNAARNAVGTLAEMVTSGMLAPADWYRQMQAEIKKEYIREYVLGRGGRDKMTPADWGRVGSMIKEQYGYLRGFLSDIETKDLTEGQIRSRSGMYVNSAREALEYTREVNAIEWGANEESWSINPLLENCIDCLGYETSGWQPLGTFPTPGDGSTQCLTNCGCVKFYRNTATGREFTG